MKKIRRTSALLMTLVMLLGIAPVIGLAEPGLLPVGNNGTVAFDDSEDYTLYDAQKLAAARRHTDLGSGIVTLLNNFDSSVIAHFTRNPSSRGSLAIVDSDTPQVDGGKALQFNYALNDGYNGVLLRRDTMPNFPLGGNWKGLSAINFWFKSLEITSRTHTLQLVNGNSWTSGNVYELELKTVPGVDPTYTGWQYVSVPIEMFHVKDNPGSMMPIGMLENIFTFAIYMGGTGNGTITLDNVNLIFAKEVVVDDFTDYANSEELQDGWVTNGATNAIALTETAKGKGMTLTYPDAGFNAAGYAGVQNAVLAGNASVWHENFDGAGFAMGNIPTGNTGLNGWTCSTANVYSFVAGEGRDGSNALRMNRTSQSWTSLFRRGIVVEPNTEYTISLWYRRARAGSSNANIVFKVHGNATATGTGGTNLTGDVGFGGTNTWTYYSQTFNTGQFSYCDVYFSDANADFFFDDIDISKEAAASSASQNWDGTAAIAFWYQGDGKGQDTVLQIFSGDNSVMEAPLSGMAGFNADSTAMQYVYLPISEFVPAAPGAVLNLSKVLGVGIRVNKSGDGITGGGTLSLGNIIRIVPSNLVVYDSEVAFPVAALNATGNDNMLKLLNANAIIVGGGRISAMQYTSDNPNVLPSTPAGKWAYGGMIRDNGVANIKLTAVQVFADNALRTVVLNTDLKITAAGMSEPIDALDYLAARGLVNDGKLLTALHDKGPNSNGRSHNQRLLEMTGVTPAMWNNDFSFVSGEIGTRQSMIEEGIRQWNDGALVSMMMHVLPPTRTAAQETSGGNWDARTRTDQNGVQAYLTPTQWADLLTDGGTLNTNWKRRLDVYAGFLQQFKDAGVRPMFRPFHEMNQHVFWWAGIPANTVALWELTHDYLVYEKGLDNMIWVFNVQDLPQWYGTFAGNGAGNNIPTTAHGGQPTGMAEYDATDWTLFVPRADTWDIFTVDVYENINDLNDPKPDINGYTLEIYQKAQAIAGDKPMAIGEFLKAPTQAQIAAQPKWTFAMLWGTDSNEGFSTSYNTRDALRTFYQQNLNIEDTPRYAFYGDDGLNGANIRFRETNLSATGSDNLIKVLNANALIKDGGRIVGMRYTSSNTSVLLSSGSTNSYKGVIRRNGTTSLSNITLLLEISGALVTEVLDPTLVLTLRASGMDPAVDVLDYLKSLGDSSAHISAMHNREPNSNPRQATQYVFDRTRETPSMWSGDFLFSQADVNNRQTMINEAIRQWNDGALVNIMMHVTAPHRTVAQETSGSNWDRRSNADQNGVQAYLTPTQWADLLTDGGALNTNWKRRLDVYAGFLQQLKDAGVRPMFRPFHEMNQHVFWWNGIPENTKALWRLTYDYLVDVKGLDNMIWVWNVQDLPDWYGTFAGNGAGNNIPTTAHGGMPTGMAEYAARDFGIFDPGDEYWDIFSLDVYENYNEPHLPLTHGYTDDLYAKSIAAAKGKPMAIGECYIPPTQAQLAAQPRWVFTMLWSRDAATEINRAYGNYNRFDTFYKENLTIADTPRFASYGEGQQGIIEDFESFANTTALRARYVSNASQVTANLVNSPFTGGGANALSITYTTSSTLRGVAGTFPAAMDITGAKSISFWYQGNGRSGQTIYFRLYNGNNIFQFDVLDDPQYSQGSLDPQFIQAPLDMFVPVTAGTVFDPANLTGIGFFIRQLGGESRNGTIYFDEVAWSSKLAEPLPASFKINFTSTNLSATGSDYLVKLLKENTTITPLIPVTGAQPYILQVLYKAEENDILLNDGLFSSKGVFRNEGNLVLEIDKVSVYANNKQYYVDVGQTINIAVSNLAEPIDPIEYLQWLTGKGHLSAMHNKEPNERPRICTDRIISDTGVTPAIWSGDFLYLAADVS